MNALADLVRGALAESDRRAAARPTPPARPERRPRASTSRLAAPTTESVTLSSGGRLLLLEEVVDLAAVTVRWKVRGPHCAGVVRLERTTPAGACEFHSGERLPREAWSDPDWPRYARSGGLVPADRLHCYRVPYRRRTYAGALVDVIDVERWRRRSGSERLGNEVLAALAGRALTAPWSPEFLAAWAAADARATFAQRGREARAAWQRVDEALAEAVAAEAALQEAGTHLPK